MFRPSARRLSLQSILIGLGVLGCVSVVGAVDQIDAQQQSKRAPTETGEFGQLVGKWRIREFGLNAGGKWEKGSGASWNFYWILGGTAIQDDWISPPLDKPAPESGRQFGTNIRIYNPKLEQWEMAWASNTGAKVDTFEATAEGRNLVMRGDFNGIDSKITFHDISAKRFSWKLERPGKVAGEWRAVYRLEAERVAE